MKILIRLLQGLFMRFLEKLFLRFKLYIVAVMPPSQPEELGWRIWQHMYTDSAHPAATLVLQQAISDCVNGKLFQYYQSLRYSELEAVFWRRGVAISKRNMGRPNKNDLVSTLAHQDAV